ncbi:hypothetical protein M501DRAFT_1006229 [Patellaria atrata CBS 101060]|uniref:P-loop containing nucleoside triphosphate hydrolase protein n=1 Tax=Patellaria atrata CBS 101060 TaxID=1346257 RepID=A0A9P4VU21_9PEZI|nr:hypothetical protein M501DRAFT_1006229 [Patellaria atrata CBS 101060]
MSQKPIFVATHPRACSTAFERVFMTRRDILQCVHEPFGDAFYYGPERLSTRYEQDEDARIKCGFSESTYKTIFENIDRNNTEGKRVFIKDITYYLLPPEGKPASIAPSLVHYKRGVGTSSEEVIDVNAKKDISVPPYPYLTAAEPGNPTVVPEQLLKQFHFTFLIRHPRSSIPSYYRCTVPPLDEVTGFYNFMPNEAGYDELRRFFDYLKSVGLIGPKFAGQSDSSSDSSSTGSDEEGQVEICVIDADDLLDDPKGILSAYCKSIGIDFLERMLKWTDEDTKIAHEAFGKWPGFHDDALSSNELRARQHKKKTKSDEEFHREWVEKYGEEGAKVIAETVKANVEDYEYLKQFAIKI